MRNFSSLRLVLLQQSPFVLFDHLLLPREEVGVVRLPAVLHAVRVGIPRVALVAAHVPLAVRLDSILTRLNVYHVLTHLVEMRFGLLTIVTRVIVIIEGLAAGEGVLCRRVRCTIYLVLPLTRRVEIPCLEHLVFNMVEILPRLSVFEQVGIVLLVLVDVSEVFIFEVVVVVLRVLVYQMLILRLILPESSCRSARGLCEAHANACVSPTEIRICLLLMLIVVHCYFL